MDIDKNMNYDEFSREQLVEAIKTLEEELNEAKEWEEKARKARADFENYKKKEDERKQRWKKEAEKDLAEQLIEVMDNLERAIASADEDSGVFQGVKMVADQLYTKIERKGLKKIDAEGEEFDPNLHKAVETEKHDQENKVLEQKRKGYMFNEKVLREAEVVVGRQEE